MAKRCNVVLNNVKYALKFPLQFKACLDSRREKVQLCCCNYYKFNRSMEIGKFKLVWTVTNMLRC